MRRREILELLKEIITDEFDDESAEAFDFKNMDEIVRVLQDDNVVDRAELLDIIQTIYKWAPHRELDQLQCGEMDNPNEWLLNQLKDSLR